MFLCCPCVAEAQRIGHLCVINLTFGDTIYLANAMHLAVKVTDIFSVTKLLCPLLHRFCHYYHFPSYEFH